MDFFNLLTALKLDLDLDHYQTRTLDSSLRILTDDQFRLFIKYLGLTLYYEQYDNGVRLLFIEHLMINELIHRFQFHLNEYFMRLIAKLNPDEYRNSKRIIQYFHRVLARIEMLMHQDGRIVRYVVFLCAQADLKPMLRYST